MCAKSPLELAGQVVFPEYSREQRKHLSNRLRKCTLKLRDAYYEACPPREEVYRLPFGGSITDSIGPWPEFILRGLPCSKSRMGCCTPCFYSRLPIVRRPAEEIHQSMIEQTANVLRDFNRLVLSNQYGPVAFPTARDRNSREAKAVAFVLTPIGSFFDEKEFPFETRMAVLRMLSDFALTIPNPLALYIETHAEDLLRAAELETFVETAHYLRSLHARVLIGLESSQPFVRNILYNKYLDFDTFQRAAQQAAEQGLGVGAFVFVGINPLNDLEMIADTDRTLATLQTMGIPPVLMFHNVQPYTIQELLYTYHAESMAEPRTVLEVVRQLVDRFPDDEHGKMDAWLIADPVGGPPAPVLDLFAFGGEATCRECTNRIYDSIVSLRVTRDVHAFKRTHEELNECQCRERYRRLLEAQLDESSDLVARTEHMITLVEDNLGDYVSVMRPIMDKVEDYSSLRSDDPEMLSRWKVEGDPVRLKAELLCYGLRVDRSVEAGLLRFNSYMREAGFVHAAHFLIPGGVVNACVAERFCEASPYLLTSRNGRFEIRKNGRFVTECDILPLPEWCAMSHKGHIMGEVLRPHSQDVISGMPNPRCQFYAAGKQCRFCSLGPLQRASRVPPSVVAEIALRALEYNPRYQLAISGGTAGTPDRSAKYFRDVARRVSKDSGMPISVELVPPDEDRYLAELRDAGVTSVIMNIEVWDPVLRAMYCPGKGSVTVERYLSAIEYAVSIFGVGQVASVLIAGMQSIEDTLDGARAIIQAGAIPTIIPFKPFDDCQMASFPRTDPSVVLTIYSEVSDLLAEAGLRPQNQKGCTGCGGCSLEVLS